MSLDDTRAPTVVAAETGTQAWESAVRHQQHATGDHSDFYALAGEIVLSLSAMRSLVAVLRRHTIGYQEMPGVYDDSRDLPGAVDPLVRLTRAAHALAELGDVLDAANRPGNAYWSAIGHIGVEVTS